ncbi:unnamed protein product [Psylliodes chrysocephalus]|uniref:Trehalase n=1 Tax=Psylliodes chrysocephalus TaxID=3402493 RepID=A0A9P0CXA9_9CUCU|nr:unnamed protein product [Psylliodes chrysocephala]
MIVFKKPFTLHYIIIIYSFLVIILLFIILRYNAQVMESCDSKIYCQGSLLDTIQRAKIFNDSKSFVDLAQRKSPSVTLKHFESLMEETGNHPSYAQVKSFIDNNFEFQGELVPWTPTDYTENPQFLTKIKNTTVADFAKKLNTVWLTLARKVNTSVYKFPDRHSIIYLPEGFVIPGGRFKEVYYWDTYWIIKGLLISGMTDTARGMLNNFVSLIRRFGFIPNGTRVYYLNRSQPPLLSAMVGIYFNYTNDKKWVKKNIDAIETELLWWLQNRAVTVKKQGTEYRLAQYSVKSGTPRPESYSEDIETCRAFDYYEKIKCYKNLKSGAESGWDFSSRWLVGSDGSISLKLEDIDVIGIVPVDLNAFLCGGFGQISRFYKMLGNAWQSKKWRKREQVWMDGISRVLYDSKDGTWYDWDINLSKPRRGFFPSNLSPLFTESFEPHMKEYYGRRAIEYLDKNNIDSFKGGIPTSLLQTGQQWDYPNAWPPLQDMIVTGLLNTKIPAGIEKARLYAIYSLDAYITGFRTTSEMFEKYDASVSGQYGGGGEYTVQTGFGWTNGAALSFIKLLYL